MKGSLFLRVSLISLRNHSVMVDFRQHEFLAKVAWTTPMILEIIPGRGSVQRFNEPIRGRGKYAKKRSNQSLPSAPER